jgi:GNAT superfamily N-acetyltransferase
MVRVRAADASDSAAIAAVHVGSWQAAYGGLIPQDFLDAMDVDTRRRRWDEIFAVDRPPTATVVLEDEGDVVGFVHYGPTRDEDGDPMTTGAVNALYLLPRAWGQGGGGTLLGWAEEAMRAAGFRHATLWVLRGNERAARIYEHLGWHKDGTTNQRDWGSFMAEEHRFRKELLS